VAIQYDFIGAKFNGFDGNVSISNRLNNNLSFNTELNPLETGRGLFISGFLSVPLRIFVNDDVFLSDDFPPVDNILDILLTQDNDLFTIYPTSTGIKLLY